MHNKMRCSPARYVMLALTLILGAPVVAAPDYWATIPCPTPKDQSAPTLHPNNDPIVRLKGAADTLVFELQPNAGVSLSVSNWKINDQEIFGRDQNGNISMKQAGSDWGMFVPGNGMKTLNWTLGGIKEGAFKLTAVLRRSCGGVSGGPGGEVQDEEMDLWGGDVLSIESISWEAINSPLDENPTDMGSGSRIFPDKNTPTDSTVRNTVRVKAKITPVKAGVKVYFRSFDVDDPSSNEAPLEGV